MIGAQFTEHSRIMPADVHIEDRKSPITKGLPPVCIAPMSGTRFQRTPGPSPGFTFSLSSMRRVTRQAKPPWAATIRSIWWHCVGKGRALYSALGHGGMMYTEPNIIQLLDNMMAWGIAESGRTCSAK